MKPSSYQESRLLSLLFLWAVDSKVRFRAELFAEQAGWWHCWVAIHMIFWYRVVAGEEFSTGRPESITEEGIRYGGNCLASVSLLAKGIGFKILWRETASRSQNIWYRTGDILGTKRASSDVMNWDRIGVTAIFHHTKPITKTMFCCHTPSALWVLSQHRWHRTTWGHTVLRVKARQLQSQSEPQLSREHEQTCFRVHVCKSSPPGDSQN